MERPTPLNDPFHLSAAVPLRNVGAYIIRAGAAEVGFYPSSRSTSASESAQAALISGSVPRHPLLMSALSISIPPAL